MRKFETIVVEDRHITLGPEEVPDVVRRVEVEIRCSEPCSAFFVLTDGQMVPIDAGRVIRFAGEPPAGFQFIDVQAPKDSTLAHCVTVSGPKHVFERVKETPLMVVDQGAEPKPIMDRLREVFLSAKPAEMHDFLEDVMADMDDDELEFEEDEDDFGDGFTEKEMSQIDQEELEDDEIRGSEDHGSGDRPRGADDRDEQVSADAGGVVGKSDRPPSEGDGQGDGR